MSKVRGFTLVEMLAVVAVSSVLLVIATGVVHRAMRLESRWEEEANVSRTLTRLARDFRGDAHQAQDAEVTQDPLGLKLTLPDSTVITYEVAADEVIRDYQSPGKSRRREFYSQPAEYQAQFTLGEEPQWVELHVTHDPHLAGVQPRTTVHVRAEVGRFSRLARSQGGTP